VSFIRAIIDIIIILLYHVTRAMIISKIIVLVIVIVFVIVGISKSKLHLYMHYRCTLIRGHFLDIAIVFDNRKNNR